MNLVLENEMCTVLVIDHPTDQTELDGDNGKGQFLRAV